MGWRRKVLSTSEMILQAAVWLQEVLFQFFFHITSVKQVRRYHRHRKCRYTVTHTVLVNKSAWWMQVNPDSSYYALRYAMCGQL